MGMIAIICLSHVLALDLVISPNSSGKFSAARCCWEALFRLDVKSASESVISDMATNIFAICKNKQERSQFSYFSMSCQQPLAVTVLEWRCQRTYCDKTTQKVWLYQIGFARESESIWDAVRFYNSIVIVKSSLPSSLLVSTPSTTTKSSNFVTVMKHQRVTGNDIKFHINHW